MKIFPSSSIKKLDAYTIEHEPIASIDLMERAAHKSCAVRLEAIVPHNFVHRQTSLNLVRCVIRTVTRHRHHPGR